MNIKKEELEIIFIFGGNPTNGAPHQVMASIWLTKNNFNVLCIAQGPENIKSIQFPIANITTNLINRKDKNLSRLFWHIKLFSHLLIKRFTTYKKSIFYIQGHPATAAATFALIGIQKSRIVYHTQDYLEPRRHRLWGLFERNFARRAGSVIINETNRARFMASQYGLENIPTVINTALPKCWPWPHRDEDHRRKIIQSASSNYDTNCARLVVHYGPLIKERCGQHIAKAISMLPNNYILILTGISDNSNNRKTTNDFLLEYGISHRTVIFPPLKFDELQNLGASCDIGLLLYPNDGIGNYYQSPGRLSEYLRAGLSIVMPNYSNNELLNTKYKIGATCNVMDPKSILKAIEELGNASAIEIQKARIHNIECATNHVNYESNSDKLIKIMEEKLQKIL